MNYTHSQLTICIDGRDPVVRIPSSEIDPAEISTPEMQQFFDDLIEAMIRYDGIGIAAPQVGYTTQAVVIHAEYAKEYTGTNEHLILVNPRIVSASDKTKQMEEGCLSVPGKYGVTDRARKVRLKALDRYGNAVDIKTKTFLARILQHEVEHLHGILYIDEALEVYDR